MDSGWLETDVLVIGAGAAGCRAALEAHDRGARVLLVAKGRLGYSGSTFYPGTMGIGYTSAVPAGEESSGHSGPEIHYREIMAAGLGMASPTLARILAEEAPVRLVELLERYRMAFQRQDGQVLFLQPDFGSGIVRAGSASTEA
ncbi:MAG: FAD-dependent oxidoreductase, partial [Anaerolineae bacterium]